MHAQLFSRLFDFPVMFSEGFQNQFLFEFIDGRRAPSLFFKRGFSSQICGETFGTDVRALAENKGVLNDILEFTNISRVVVIQQYLQGWVSEPADASAPYLVKAFQNVVNEKGKVLRSLSQRRDIYGDHIESIVEVFPKFP